MKIKKIGAIFMLVLGMAMLLTGCGQKNVAATVNGETISSQDYYKRLTDVNKQFAEQMAVDFSSKEGQELQKNNRQQVLDGMIEEVLVRQAAKKENVLPTTQDVDNKIKEIKSSYPAEEDYQKDLKKLNVTEAQLKSVILIDLAQKNLYQKVTASIKDPSEAEAKEYYNKNKTQFTEPEQLQVRHILFFVSDGKDPNIPVKRSDAEGKKMAEDVITRLNKGEDFATIAKEKSEDGGSKDDGGIYVFAPSAGTTDPAFSQAAESLAKGEYTKAPVRSQFGYHIIKLEEKIEGTEHPFEELKGQILAQLAQEKKDIAFKDYLEKLKKEAKIEKMIKE